jgi:hypothetical protein
MSVARVGRHTEVSSCRSVRRVGHIDLRAHTKILNALRADTPTPVLVEAFGAQVKRTGERNVSTRIHIGLLDRRAQQSVRTNAFCGERALPGRCRLARVPLGAANGSFNSASS